MTIMSEDRYGSPTPNVSKTLLVLLKARLQYGKKQAKNGKNIWLFKILQT
jgi:hypothetical protein